MATTAYAIFNAEDICINRVLWDGESDWQPPAGCTVVPDPDNTYPIHVEPKPEAASNPLDSLTAEQREALIAFLQPQQG